MRSAHIWPVVLVAVVCLLEYPGISVSNKPDTDNVSEPDEESIVIEGVPLSLGMSMETAMTELAKTFALQQTSKPPGDQYQLVGKDGSGHFGFVVFQNGVLRNAGKDWKFKRDSTYDMATAIIKLLSQFEEQGNTHCSLMDVTWGRAWMNTAVFMCGARSLTVIAAPKDRHGNPAALLMEIIGPPDLSELASESSTRASTEM